MAGWEWGDFIVEKATGSTKAFGSLHVSALLLLLSCWFFPAYPPPPTPPPHHHTALLQLSQQLSPQAIESKEFFPVLFCFVSLRNLMESQKYPSLF